MNANSESSDQDYDDELPDFSTPEWVERFLNAPVSPGEPIDLDSVRVRNLPDGTTRVSCKMLPEGADAPGANSIAASRPIPPTTAAFETTPEERSPIGKLSSA